MNKIDKYKMYGRAKGRKKISELDNFLFKKYQLKLDKDFIDFKKVILDIGSGSGENTIFLAKKNPNNLIIAIDNFKDGNIDLCNLIEKLHLKNIKIYPGNINKLLDLLEYKNKKKIHQIWILFPDPWPKKRHHKRRLINDNFMELIFKSIALKTSIYIATDSSSYLQQILITLFNNKLYFKWLNDKPFEWDYGNYNFPHTKYYKKAKRSKNFPFLINLCKI